MSVEIERKYLVKKPLLEKELPNYKGTTIVQGYLNLEKERAVRVRLSGKVGYITIKGSSNGINRQEFEYEIPLADALELLDMCTHRAISKTRYEINHKGKTWEVDVFEGQNSGLVVAEIELESESEEISLPNWIDTEVSDDSRYYNLSLYLKPYSEWT